MIHLILGVYAHVYTLLCAPLLSIMTCCILCAFPMFITCHAYIGAPRGVTVLEYELPEPEEQQGELSQGAEEEDLPECPDHRPSTYVEGKPRSIISLLLFLLSCPAINWLCL